MASPQDIPPNTSLAISLNVPPVNNSEIIPATDLPTLEEIYPVPGLLPPATSPPRARPRRLINAHISIYAGPIDLIAADIFLIPTTALSAVHRSPDPADDALHLHVARALAATGPGPRALPPGTVVGRPGRSLGLATRHVIHAIGPCYSNGPTVPHTQQGNAVLDDLASCYHDALGLAGRLARRHRATTLAVAAIGSNRDKRGFPSIEGAWVACKAVRRYLDFVADACPFERIVFVVTDYEDLCAFLDAIT